MRSYFLAIAFDVLAVWSTQEGRSSHETIAVAAFAQSCFDAGTARQPRDQELFDDMLARQRALVPSGEFNDAWSAGKALSIEDACALAASL